MKATVHAIASGTYDPKAAIGVLFNLAGVIGVLAAQADSLPPRIAPYVKLAQPWAFMLLAIGTFFAAQGKPLIVPKGAGQ